MVIPFVVSWTLGGCFHTPRQHPQMTLNCLKRQMPLTVKRKALKKANVIVGDKVGSYRKSCTHQLHLREVFLPPQIFLIL